MRVQDIANQILDAIEKGNVRSTSKLYTDDFRFSGLMPTTHDKDQFFSFMSKVTSAVPDWKFNRHDVRVEDQTVVIPIQVTGTQTQKLSPLTPDMREMPATNRSFQLPPETLRFTFRGDRVSNIQLEPVPGGGIPGMLEQLEAAIPVTGKKNK